jgi:hypothetical protein
VGDPSKRVKTIRRTKICPVTGRRSFTAKVFKTPILTEGFSDIYGALLDTGDRLMTTVEYALGDTMARSVVNNHDFGYQVRKSTGRLLKMVNKKMFSREGIDKWKKINLRVTDPIMLS